MIPKKIPSALQNIEKALKFRGIDELKLVYGVSLLCRYFNVSRSGFYAWINHGKPLYKAYKQDIAILIKEIFDAHEKGYPYITMQ